MATKHVYITNYREYIDRLTPRESDSVLTEFLLDLEEEVKTNGIKESILIPYNDTTFLIFDFSHEEESAIYYRYFTTVS